MREMDGCFGVKRTRCSESFSSIYWLIQKRKIQHSYFFIVILNLCKPDEICSLNLRRSFCGGRSEFIMHEIIKKLLREIPDSQSQTQTLVCIFDFWTLPYSDRHMVSSNAYHVYVSTVLVIYTYLCISNSNKKLTFF